MKAGSHRQFSYSGANVNDLLAQLDRATLSAIAGPAPAKKAERQLAILKATAATLTILMGKFEINTERRIEHFLAQLGHESDSFCTTEEYASGAAYEGREDLGNTERGDGTRFKGRGLIQLTGRANYRKFTAWMRSTDPSAPNFETSPDLVAEFPWAAWSAIWYWSTRKLNVLADRDDLVGITKIINGGKNGLADREHRLAIARRKVEVKAVITPIAAMLVERPPDGFPVLFKGVSKPNVVEFLQRSLSNLGFYHLAIDGDFGAGTEQAVKAFQTSKKLKADGIVGAKTLAAIEAALGVE